MATSIMREIWRASDGKEFATEVEALKHEEADRIYDFLNNHPDLYFGREDSSSIEAIAKALVDAYILTPIPSSKAS